MPSLRITHFQQHHEADCLAAAANMLLTFWQKPVRYNRLLRLLKIDTDEAGASFYQLEQLQTLGVTAEIYYGHMDALELFLSDGYPIIASIDTRDLPYWNGQWVLHAVVISGIDEGTVSLHDPAFPNAPQIVERNHFESAWLHREYLYCRLYPT